MNLPNSLTLLRIFFVPVLIVILLTKSPNLVVWGVSMHFEVWGVLILLLAAATDWADGYLARRRLQVTTLGILLDPIADKLLISAAFISLVDMQLVPAWMVVIIIGREFTVLGLRNIASAEGFTIEDRKSTRLNSSHRCIYSFPTRRSSDLGYLARRRLQVTTLGILLDPIADKLLISAAFISLVDMQLVPAWMVVIIIGREFTVLGLRNIASAEGFTIEASTLGKTKMVLQVCAVAVQIVGAQHPSLNPLARILLWLVVII